MSSHRASLVLVAVVALALLTVGCSGSDAGRAGATTSVVPVTSASTSSPGLYPSTTSVATQATSPTVTSTPRVAPTTTRVSTGAPPSTTAQGPPASATGQGGIAGHVYLGCSSGPPSGAACQTQQGVPGVTIEVTSGDATVARTQTGSDGAYRVDVPAGLYSLDEIRDGQHTRVQVEAGLIVVANFTVA